MRGIRNLDKVALGLGLPVQEWRLFRATDVSDDGMPIVGTGLNPQGIPEAFVVQVPAAPLVAVIAAGLPVLRRRRRR